MRLFLVQLGTMKKRNWILLLAALLLVWIVVDLFFPFKTDLSKIDPVETARLEGSMWRSYYEKKPVKLFFQSAELMRKEFHFSFWQSFHVAYYPAKAAFVFKDGKGRVDYEKAFPYLKKYYTLINNVSEKDFNADSAARSELEWWIIRREREKHPPEEWERWLALTAAVMYHLPVERFNNYAHLRVQAMLLRDQKGLAITERDWQDINKILLDAWQSFANELNSPPVSQNE